ncbi:MAG: hypothetical protein ABR971_04445 [Acidobacteriaceae bacterium]|jgi:hypothetical protein
MGMVPIPVISPLTLTRLDEPVLEPPLPVSRVDAESSNTGGGADEGYHPSQQSPPHPDPGDAETQAATVASDPTHQVNLFA